MTKCSTAYICIEAIVLGYKLIQHNYTVLSLSHASKYMSNKNILNMHNNVVMRAILIMAPSR